MFRMINSPTAATILSNYKFVNYGCEQIHRLDEGGADGLIIHMDDVGRNAWINHINDVDHIRRIDHTDDVNCSG